MPLTYKDVAEILKIIDASGLDEISIEVDGAKMHVRRAGRGSAPEPLPPMAGPAPSPVRATPAARAAQEPARPKAAPATAAPQSSQHSIRAPMLGSFYRAPSPKDPPFVEVGSLVKRGDPLCLIEVMKLFTTISADTDGQIAQILPANGDLVEFDQILFLIESA
ncbi:MAG: acetyl-CoA carboxylase biotin carboxyl carrier protein [Hyphomonadaceae bacterium]|nr:acetyl-CoA carboxylase biotin carboxyl carrier protein [Hyphomonadaceae bacterium]